MNEEKETDVCNEFEKVLAHLTDEEFWKYVSSWLSEEFVLDIMRNWDIETKEEAIKEMNKLKGVNENDN